jgi:transposase
VEGEGLSEAGSAGKKLKADIYFWDEAGFRADAVQGRTWGKKGHTPVIEVPGQRQTISAASTVNAKGAFWFATYQGGLNADLFVGMLELLMKHRRRQLFLVLDNLATHKAKVVNEYVASTQGKIELHYLPGYAPELNSDELVWNDMKRTRTARRPLAKGRSLQDNIEADMLAIRRNPALVKSFFQAPYVAYITD